MSFFISDIERTVFQYDAMEPSIGRESSCAKGSLSLTDAVSFMLMRREGIETVYSFDRQLENEGFVVVS